MRPIFIPTPRGKWIGARAAFARPRLLLALIWPKLGVGLLRGADANANPAGSIVAVPMWVLCVACAIGVVTLCAVAVLLFRLLAARKSEAAPLTTAEVMGIRWRWTNREGEIHELTSHCPQCDRKVLPKTETRHGFLHLISFQCECRKWRSPSLQCSQSALLERVRRTVREQAGKRRVVTPA